MTNSRIIQHLFLYGLGIFTAGVFSNALAFEETVTVDARAGIYAVEGNTGGSGSIPAPFVTFDVNTNDLFEITAAGYVHWSGRLSPNPSPPAIPPDGVNTYGTNIVGINGLSDTVGNSRMPLLGVFTDGTNPVSLPKPTPLIWDKDAPTSLSPVLRQVFYIGDGRSGYNNSSGAVLRYRAPNGAVKLFLGVADAPNFSGTPGFYADNIGSFVVTVKSAVIPVTIDIKPGSDPNSINLCSQGALPVVIFSEPDFDATQIDPTTLRLADAEVKMVGKSEKVLCHDEYINDDAYLDKVCQFVTVDLALDGEVDTTATILGNLLDGTAFEGTDSVNLVKDCP